MLHMLNASSEYLLSKIEELIKEEAFILFVAGDLRIERDGDEFVRIVVCDITRIIIEPELVRFETTGGITILYYDMEEYKVVYLGSSEKKITRVIKEKIKEIMEGGNEKLNK